MRPNPGLTQDRAALVSSADRVLSSEERVALASLADELGQSGLGEYFACFDPLRPRQGDWYRYCRYVPSRLRPLVDLFLLNEPVGVDRLPDAIRLLLPVLVRLGLVEEADDGAQLQHGLVLLPVFGRWIFCHPPGENPLFYFCDDSLGLLTRILPRAGGPCLDLCSGPGLLALHSAGIASHVTAVEVNADAAHLARLNVAMNKLTGRVDVLQGDLFAPVSGRRFDTIVANPPMLPYPAALKAPFIGHGGSDGLHVARRVLAGLSEALTESGTAQIIGMCLSDGVVPVAMGALQEIAQGQGLDLTVSVLSHKSLAPGSPLLEALVATVAVASRANESSVRAAYDDLCAQFRATHVCDLFIHARRGEGALDVIDVARASDAGE